MTSVVLVAGHHCAAVVVVEAGCSEKSSAESPTSGMRLHDISATIHVCQRTILINLPC